MKYLKRGAAILMALAIIFVSCGTTAWAQDAKAGETVTVYFSYSNTCCVDGTFSFSNSGMFSSVSYDTSGVGSGLMGSVSNNYAYFFSTGENINGQIDVVCTVSSSASAGDSCTITFNYNTSSDAGVTMVGASSSQTVTVVASEEAAPAETPAVSEAAPAESSASSSSGTSESTSKTEVTETEDIDYTELNKQISIAEGLTQSDYTNDSWEAMQEALSAAYGQQKGTSQTKVDAAASALKEAIAALVEIDYSELEAAIAAAEELRDSDELGQLWTELLSELVDAADLLTSGDQEAVDAAAASLRSLIEQIEEKMDELSETEEVVKEVEVEVLPEGRYCNIPIHKVWPILFFISLALNAFFIIMQLYVTKKKKKDEEDDTPTVEYNADDDL
ncbi:MAG: hypothetical protein LUD71_01025 [Clostridiales bacterium]|nr:hypothetical protein [Clostridiales bacterium]